MQDALANKTLPDWSNKSTTLLAGQFGSMVGEVGGFAFSVMSYFNALDDGDYLGATASVKGAVAGGALSRR
ncbi:MAG TPA: hypothetical protein DCF45_12095 [Gammaproteobacteria bacterium]|nr:hypothetical protein [Gammaproteobacteria bacterium]